MNRRSFAAACIALSAVGGMEPAFAGDRPLYEIGRDIRAAQDDAFRDRAARDANVRESTREFEAAAGRDASIWNDRRNRIALVAYLLRGGAARESFAAAALAAGSDEKPLVQGAVALAEGRDDEATKLLGSLDLLATPPSIGGAAALALARLTNGKDDAAFRRYIDLAKLLSPGTLIEEAAMRQEIFVASRGDDVERFVNESRRYVNRFQAAAYFGNFLRRFEAYFIRVWVAADDSRRQRLERAISRFPDRTRRVLSLSLAREALLSGDSDGARVTARRATEGDNVADDLVARRKLYEAAADIFGSRRAAARHELSEARPDMLEPLDRIIRAGAMALADGIDRDAAPSKKEFPSDVTSPATQAVRERIDAAAASLDRAK